MYLKRIAEYIGFILLILTCFLIEGKVLFAQEGSFLDQSNLRPLTAGGSIGFSASAYAVDGIENRRSPTVVQANANMNFSVFGLRSGLNLNYSTDDTGLRQNMNNLSFNATWKWLNVQAGDVNSKLSQYGLNGTTIRGGYIRMEPGNFLLELTGGRSQRAVRPSVESGFRQPAFEQWAAGGKIGFGNPSSSYFHLSSFYAIDEKFSINNSVIEITPRENLTLTPDFQIEIFKGRLTIGSEVTTSLYTRDLNSGSFSLEEAGVPRFFSSLYTPRSSSRINYAGTANANLNLDLFNLGLGYERVQPGFRSLGRGRVRDDQEKIIINPALRLLNNRLNISSNISLGRDNLMNNRIQSQRNSNFNNNIQIVFSETINLNVVYGLILNNVSSESINDENPGNDQSQISHNLMLQPGFTFRGDKYTHNISITGGYLTIESKFDNQNQTSNRSFSSKSITSALGYTITMPSGMSVSSSANYLTNQSGDVEIQNLGFNLGSSYSFFDRRLSVSANAGFSNNSSERENNTGNSTINKLQQLSGSLNSSYRLTGKDSFSITMRTRSNRVIQGGGRQFSELEGTFQYQRRF